MFILLKSEMDSRVLLYPLLKSLKSYGNILVVSSNRVLNRLVDEANGGFRNIRIIVDEAGAADDLFTAYNIAANDFDFIILDNVGTVDYDRCLILKGAKSTEAFDDNVRMLLDEDEEAKMTVFQFGRPQAKKSTPTDRKSRSRGGPPTGATPGEEVEDDYDPVNKFRDEIKAELAKGHASKTYNCKFPSMEQIEAVEADYKFYEVDTRMAEGFYAAFDSVLAVEKVQFIREVRKKDAGSYNFEAREG